jgi:hypothetical protein
MRRPASRGDQPIWSPALLFGRVPAAVEFEIRRLDSQLGALEERQSYARLNAACPWQEPPELLDAEIGRLRARMRVLLDAGG